MAFLTGLAAKAVANGVFKLFGEAVVQPLLTAFLQSKDVDLEKFKSANASTTQLAAAVLDANVKFAEIKANYALSILQWWPFRVILFALLFFPTLHFVLITIDSSCWATAARPKGGCGFGIPEVPPKYIDIEHQLLLFFVLAKPVDSAVSGAIAALRAFLEKRR
jgi:hypothetical protein